MWTSAVFWGWVGNGLRLASSILLLPLLSVLLSKADFGYYSLLTTLGMLIALADLGFSAALMRNIGYAMSGAKSLVAIDSAPPTDGDGKPNPILLFHLLGLTRTVYRWLALATFCLIGAWGTYWTFRYAPQTSQPAITWAAWLLTLLSGVWEMYSGWWNTYLRGLNMVMNRGASRKQIPISNEIVQDSDGILTLPALAIGTELEITVTGRNAVGESSPSAAVTALLP